MSRKSVKQECLTGDLHNSVKQGRPTRVSPQRVNSGCLTSEFAGSVTNKYCLCLSTYVSAFGFVGFILFDVWKRFGASITTSQGSWVIPRPLHITSFNPTGLSVSTWLRLPAKTKASDLALLAEIYHHWVYTRIHLETCPAHAHSCRSCLGHPWPPQNLCVELAHRCWPACQQITSMFLEAKVRGPCCKSTV